MTNLSSQTSNDLSEEPESDEDDDSIADHRLDRTTDEDSSDPENDDSSDDEVVLTSQKSNFDGVKIHDRIIPLWNIRILRSN